MSRRQPLCFMKLVLGSKKNDLRRTTAILAKSCRAAVLSFGLCGLISSSSFGQIAPSPGAEHFHDAGEQKIYYLFDPNAQGSQRTYSIHLVRPQCLQRMDGTFVYTVTHVESLRRVFFENDVAIETVTAVPVPSEWRFSFRPKITTSAPEGYCEKPLGNSLPLTPFLVDKTPGTDSFVREPNKSEIAQSGYVTSAPPAAVPHEVGATAAPAPPAAPFN